MVGDYDLASTFGWDYRTIRRQPAWWLNDMRSCLYAKRRGEAAEFDKIGNSSPSSTGTPVPGFESDADFHDQSSNVDAFFRQNRNPD